MNVWFESENVKRAELDVFMAERKERRGDLIGARALYHGAGEAFASTALCVTSDHPNTRSDLAIAAVASFSRAGDFRAAVDIGERILAEEDALTEHGRLELLRLVRIYNSIMAAVRPPKGSAAQRGASVRDEVRSQFRSAA